MRIYSIYDTKAEQYGNPVFMRTDAEARRGFGQVAADTQTEIGRHPEDFILYRIGTWNPEKGVITPEAGTCIAKAIEFLAQAAPATITEMRNALTIKE